MCSQQETDDHPKVSSAIKISSRSLPSPPGPWSCSWVAQVGHDRVPSERVMSVIPSRRKALFFIIPPHFPRNVKRAVVLGLILFQSGDIPSSRHSVYKMAGLPRCVANECRRASSARGRRCSNSLESLFVECRSGRILRCIFDVTWCEQYCNETQSDLLDRERRQNFLVYQAVVVVVVVIVDTNKSLIVANLFVTGQSRALSPYPGHPRKRFQRMRAVESSRSTRNRQVHQPISDRGLARRECTLVKHPQGKTNHNTYWEEQKKAMNKTLARV